MAEVTEEARLRAEVAQAKRRRDGANRAAEALRKEIEAMRAQLANTRSSELQVGDQVRLKGVADMPKLNGEEAELVSKEVKKGRCKVRFAGGEVRQLPASCIELLRRPGQQSALQLVEEPTPLLSASRLRLRSCLSEKAGGLPCELLPLVHSCVARALVPDSVVAKLNAQLDGAVRRADVLDCSSQLRGEIRKGCQVTIERLDKEFEVLLLRMSSTLAWALLGGMDFRCEIDAVWGVVQREGDYCPMQGHKSTRSRAGFAALLDVALPPSLSPDNHERPPKGSYGFHDGLHNILWKTDRTTDLYDLVQPGIIQCELITGYLYIYPQQLQAYTLPFEGKGDRKWIAATVALLDSNTP